MSLVDLPTEILVQVFASLDSLRDAVNLSKTCSRFDRLLNDTWNMATIFNAIADKIVLPKTPNAAWLETHFGPDCLWKPSRCEIPRRFSHAQTLEFLATIGFPDRSIGLHGTYLQHFRKSIEQDQSYWWPFTIKGRVGQTTADTGIYWPGAYYILGSVGGKQVTVDYKIGTINSYAVSVRDIGQGPLLATSIMSFLVMLGPAVSSRNAIKELIQRSTDPLKLAMGVWCLEKVYLKMQQYDPFLNIASRVWWDLLFDGVDYTGYSFSTARLLRYGIETHDMAIGNRLRLFLGTT